jgi:hypothetical protein
VGKDKTNKYAGLFEARRTERERTAAEPVAQEPDPAAKKVPGEGKRADPDYRQVSAYVRKDTHQKVKIALIEEDRQFSELVEKLLRGWLDSRT